MATFASFGEMAQFFVACDRKLGPAIVRELQAQGPALVAETRRYFGTYGPGWAVLAESTQKERARKGFTPDDPLFRAGDLQGLIGFKVTGESLFVGIPDDATLPDGTDASLVMNALNDGTADGRIPPRPVFEQAMAQLPRFMDAFALGVKIRMGL